MIKVEEKRRRIEASFLDGLFKDLSKSMFAGLLEQAEDGARNILGWTLHRVALTFIAVGICVAAVILLLIAGVEGLREASVPRSVAYLIGGVVGLGTAAGVYFYKR